MDQQTASQPELDKLWHMMREIKVAILTTDDGDVLRSRPMVVSQSDFDGTLWFFTRASSHKVIEVARDTRVNVTYADPQHQTYVSLSGPARLVRDTSAIDAHWSEPLRTWFPDGRADPDVALIRVDVTKAEYWDAPSSAMVHAYGYVKSVLTGQPPHPGDHAKVELR